MREVENENANREREYELALRMMVLPLVIAVFTYIVIKAQTNNKSCFIMESGYYKIWLPNLTVDKEKIVTIFGQNGVCQYYSTISVAGVSFIFWTIWKFIRELRGGGYSTEAKLAKIFFVPCLLSLIWLNLDFVDYGTIYRKTYLSPMLYCIALDLFFQFVFFGTFGSLLARLAQSIRQKFQKHKIGGHSDNR